MTTTRRPRIPAGRQRVELIDTKDSKFTWHKLSANYQVIGGAGQTFTRKASARKAAEKAEAVIFPEGQDWVDTPAPA